MDGNCNDWSTFTNYATRLPYDEAYYSKLVMYYGGYDYSTKQAHNNTVSCSDPSVLSMLVQSLNNNVQFDQICNFVRFRVDQCPGVGNVMCANCRVVCPANPCGTSVVTGDIRVAPCQECNYRKATYQIAHFSFEAEILYPIIQTPLIVTTTRTSIEVAVNISKSGSIYCYAAPSTEVISTVLTLKSKGTFHLASSRGVSVITVPNLSPNTNYTVYCYTEDFSAHGMPLDTVVSFGKKIKTKCCPQVVFLNVPSTSPELSDSFSTSSLPTYSFIVDAERFSWLRVNLTMIRTGSCSYGSASDGATVSPSRLTFKNSENTKRSFIVNGSPGCYRLVASLRTEKNIVVNTTQSLAITSASSSTEAPILKQAILSRDGLQLLITFDRSTDKAISKLSLSSTIFACNQLFSFQNAAASTCLWTSESQVTATLPSNSFLMYKNVSVLKDSIQSMFCSNVIQIGCRFTPHNISVLVQTPYFPVVPFAVVSAPKQISQCDNLVIDATDSYGSANHDWKIIEWSIVYTAPDSTNATLYWQYSKALSAWLTNYCNGSTFDKISIPKAQLRGSGDYVITMALTNVFNKTSKATTAVKIVASNDVPSVRIVGPKTITTYRSNPVNLIGEVSVSSCKKADVKNTYTYLWTIFKGGEYVKNLPSLSNSPTMFKLDAYSFEPLTVYTVQFVVVTKDSQIYTASVRIQVDLNEVFALIAGGSYQRIAATSRYTLDGSSSYSLDSPTNSSVLRYRWTCVETTLAYFGASCTGFTLGNRQKNVISLASYRGSSAVRTLSFTLFVTTLDGITANTTMVLDVTPVSNAPVVSLSPVIKKYTSTDKIVATAKIIGSLPSFAIWSIEDSSVNSSTSFLTSRSIRVNSGTRTFQQAIRGNVFTPGRTYTLRLSAWYTGESSLDSVVFSEVILNINNPPQNGLLTVSPREGKALNTTFRLLTYGWADEVEDLPISYSLEYMIYSDQPASLLKSADQTNSITGFIGAGLSEKEYNVTCIARATDNLGASNSVSTIIKVYPFTKTTSALNRLVTSLLADAVKLQDTVKTNQVITAALRDLNSANCSAASNSYCSSLNRENCLTTPNTCGACKSGFSGQIGDANSGCYATSHWASLTQTLSCVHNSDCSVSRRCINGTCALPSKSCPNDCSEHGICSYVDYFKQPVEYCPMDNPYCDAVCQCDTGYFGRDCAYDQTEFKIIKTMRRTMCRTLYSMSKYQDGNSDVVKNRAITVSNLLLDSSQLDVNTTSDCAYVVINSVEDYPDIVGDYGVYGYIMNAFSAVAKLDTITDTLREDVQSAMSTLIDSIQSQQAVGESLDPIVTSSMSFASSVYSPNNTAKGTIFEQSVPQSDLQKALGVPASGVGLAATSSKSSADESVGVAVFQFNGQIKNATTASAEVSVKTKSMAVKTKTVQEMGIRKLFELDTLATAAEDSKVFITAQNFQPIQYFQTVPERDYVYCDRTGYNYTLSRNCSSMVDYIFECPGNAGKIYNYTCPIFTLTPFCLLWDSESGSYVEDSSTCKVYEHSATNITCVCSTQGLERRRRLQSVTGNNGLIQLSTIAEVVVTPFAVEVAYLGTPEFPPIEHTVMTSTASAILFFIFLTGLSIFGYREYKAKRSKQVGMKKFAADNNPFSPYNAIHLGMLLMRNSFFPMNKEDLPEKIVPARKYGNVSSGESDYSPRKQFGQQRPGSAKDGVVVPAPTKHKQKVVTLQWFFNSLLPIEFTGISWFEKLEAKCFAEHDLAVLTHQTVDIYNPANINNNLNMLHSDILKYPENHQRSLRWTLAFGRIINLLFWDTLLVSLFYADDGTCEQIWMEEDCMAKRSMFGLNHLCTWQAKLETSCQFNQQSIDNYFALSILIGVVIILAIPFEHIFRFVATAVHLTLFSRKFHKRRAAKQRHQNPTTHGNEKEKEKEKEKKGSTMTIKVSSAGETKNKPRPKTDKTKATKVVPVIAASSVVAAVNYGQTIEGNPNALVMKTTRHYEMRTLMGLPGAILRGARLELILNMTDRLTARKEVSMIMETYPYKEVRKHLHNGLLDWLYIISTKIRGNQFYYETGDNMSVYGLRILHELKRSRGEVKALRDSMQLCFDKDVDRDTFLIQQFLLYSLTPTERHICASYFDTKVALYEHFSFLSDRFVQGVAVIMGVWLMLMMIFIIVMGLSIGSKSSFHWFYVCLLCLFYEWSIVQPYKILWKWVVDIGIVQPKLRLLHAMLRERSRYILTRRYGVMRTYQSLIQHFHPVVRLARYFPELPASKMLISLHDHDLLPEKWAPKHKNPFVIFGQFLLRIIGKAIIFPAIRYTPILLQEFVVDLWKTIILCGIGICLVWLRSWLYFPALAIAIVYFLVATSAPFYFTIRYCLKIYREWRIATRNKRKVYAIAEEFDELGLDSSNGKAKELGDKVGDAIEDPEKGFDNLGELQVTNSGSALLEGSSSKIDPKDIEQAMVKKKSNLDKMEIKPIMSRTLDDMIANVGDDDPHRIPPEVEAAIQALREKQMEIMWDYRKNVTLQVYLERKAATYEKLLKFGKHSTTRTAFGIKTRQKKGFAEVQDIGDVYRTNNTGVTDSGFGVLLQSPAKVDPMTNPMRQQQIPKISSASVSAKTSAKTSPRVPVPTTSGSNSVLISPESPLGAAYSPDVEVPDLVWPTGRNVQFRDEDEIITSTAEEKALEVLQSQKEPELEEKKSRPLRKRFVSRERLRMKELEKQRKAREQEESRYYNDDTDPLSLFLSFDLFGEGNEEYKDGRMDQKRDLALDEKREKDQFKFKVFGHNAPYISETEGEFGSEVEEFHPKEKKIVPRPAKESMRIPRDIRRKKDAWRRKKAEEEQKRHDEGFEFDFSFINEWNEGEETKEQPSTVVVVPPFVPMSVNPSIASISGQAAFTRQSTGLTAWTTSLVNPIDGKEPSIFDGDSDGVIEESSNIFITPTRPTPYERVVAFNLDPQTDSPAQSPIERHRVHQPVANSNNSVVSGTSTTNSVTLRSMRRARERRDQRRKLLDEHEAFAGSSADPLQQTSGSIVGSDGEEIANVAAPNEDNYDLGNLMKYGEEMTLEQISIEKEKKKKAKRESSKSPAKTKEKATKGLVNNFVKDVASFSKRHQVRSQRYMEQQQQVAEADEHMNFVIEDDEQYAEDMFRNVLDYDS